MTGAFHFSPVRKGRDRSHCKAHPPSLRDGAGRDGGRNRQLSGSPWMDEICSSENEIYVTEILNWRGQKLLLHPGK
jgi:hypothetical protein